MILASIFPRLSIQLAFAFTIYTTLLWGGMICRNPTSLKNVKGHQTEAIKRLLSKSYAVFSVLAITAASGAFVAGNDAGHAYNDWPLFAGRVVPDELWEEELGHRNFFENTATVQFDHRMLAYTSLASVLGLFFFARRPTLWPHLPDRARKAVNSMAAMTVAQVSLGITTLLLYVPIPLAAFHQGGSVVVWSTAVWLLHALKYTR